MDLRPEKDETSATDASNLLFTSIVIIIIIVFIVVGVFVGFAIGQNKNNQASTAQTLNQLVTPVANPSGLQFTDSSQQQTAPNADASGWTMYSDVNFSIKYPLNWLVKKGFSSQSDIVIYDPKSIQQTTQNGQVQRIPSSYVDIMTVAASTMSAQQTLDNYAKQSSNSAIRSEQSPTLKDNQVLFNSGSGPNTVLWTQNGMMAEFTGSIQHLNDTSIENKILQTFQFIK